MKLILIVFVLLGSFCSANEDLSLDVAYYIDSREYDTTSITSGYKLPNDFDIWGFTDLQGDQDEGHGSIDRSFSEYRLSYLINNGFGIQAEYNYSTPSDNHVARLGLTYKHHFNKSWVQFRIFPVETDGNGGQVSLIYSFPITTNISFGGFADLNWDEEGSDRWVIEPQLSYRINDHIYMNLEFRYNGFEDVQGDGKGIAIGIQYKF